MPCNPANPVPCGPRYGTSGRRVSVVSCSALDCIGKAHAPLYQARPCGFCGNTLIACDDPTPTHRCVPSPAPVWSDADIVACDHVAELADQLAHAASAAGLLGFGSRTREIAGIARRAARSREAANR